jgi:hypothetical protein
MIITCVCSSSEMLMRGITTVMGNTRTRTMNIMDFFTNRLHPLINGMILDMRGICLMRSCKSGGIQPRPTLLPHHRIFSSNSNSNSVTSTIRINRIISTTTNSTPIT